MRHADLYTLRILVVDDDSSVLEGYRNVFSSDTRTFHTRLDERLVQTGQTIQPLAVSFELTIARNREEALLSVRDSISEASPFVIAFVEAQPKSGEDGTKTAEAIRELDSYTNIVISSATPNLKPEDFAWRIPPTDKLLFVRKPLDSEEVRHFATALSAKWNVERQLRKMCFQLQDRIEESTTELTAINERLSRKVGEHRAIEDALRNSERFLGDVLDAIQDGISVLSKDLSILRVNRTLEKWHPDSMPLVGKKCYEVYHRRHEPCTGCPALEVLAEGSLRMEVIPEVTAEGEEKWYEVYLFPIVDASGQTLGLVEYVRDISERVHAERQLLHDAFHDKLTGLPNRALFLDRVEQVLRRTRRHTEYVFAVLIVDLDRFKILNDSLGHTIGDELLVAISSRLMSCIRTGDTAARLGGDEFALLLDGIRNISDATRVAERVQHELSKPFVLGNHEVYASASVGIALSSSAYDKSEDLLRNADTAMFRAKALGKSRHEVFDSAMHSLALKQLQLENDLRRALDRDEFRVHYQPIIDLRSGHIAGFEALIRWQHPEKGLVPPNDFIPVAEETGLIVPIGRWILHEASRQISIWQMQFPQDDPLTMSVNISGKQFADNDLCEVVQHAIRASALYGQTLRLELTESEIMEQAESAVSRLTQLKTLGVQIYIDDFGTGYSSLSYLHRFPIDALKIDRSFTQNVTVDDESGRIVKTIVMLSHDLGLDVIVEGIETLEQLQKIRTLDCEYAQGYYFSKPVDQDKASALLRSKPSW